MAPGVYTAGSFWQGEPTPGGGGVPTEPDECSTSGTFTVNANEFTSIRRRMYDAAFAKWGKDVLASAIEPQGPVPYTPPEYARQCAEVWRDLWSKIGGRYIVPLKLPSEQTEWNALRDGLVELYESLKLANFGRSVADGIKVMDPYTTRWFWDDMQTLALAFQARSGEVTVGEEWRAALCGGKQGLNNAAQTVGEVAGKIAKTIGEAAGAGIGGVLEGVGLVNVALIAGGVYVVTKVF